MYRQGDILILKIEKLGFDSNPDAYTSEADYWKPVIAKDNIILLGESTGHAHRLEAGQVIKYQNDIYLVLDEASRIVHDEHAPIELEPGKYIIRRQREYVSPDEERTIYD